jgi:hypothetical protein
MIHFTTKHEYVKWLLLLLLLLRWGKAASLWKRVSNGRFVHPPDDLWVNMVHQWNDIHKKKPKHLEKNLSQCHFVHRKSDMDWPGRETGPRQWQTGDKQLWAMSGPHNGMEH